MLPITDANRTLLERFLVEAPGLFVVKSWKFHLWIISDKRISTPSVFHRALMTRHDVFENVPSERWRVFVEESSLQNKWRTNKRIELTKFGIVNGICLIDDCRFEEKSAAFGARSAQKSRYRWRFGKGCWRASCLEHLNVTKWSQAKIEIFNRFLFGFHSVPIRFCTLERTFVNSLEAEKIEDENRSCKTRINPFKEHFTT